MFLCRFYLLLYFSARASILRLAQFYLTTPDLSFLLHSRLCLHILPMLLTMVELANIMFFQFYLRVHFEQLSEAHYDMLS